jgi:hypothetical protein
MRDRVAKGLFRLEKDGVGLAFEIEDGIVGIVKSGVKTVHLNYADLESITYKKGWFSARIVLEASSMRVFEDLPGSEQGTCKLKVKKKDRKEAEKIISTARMHLSEYKLDQLDSDHD